MMSLKRFSTLLKQQIRIQTIISFFFKKLWQTVDNHLNSKCCYQSFYFILIVQTILRAILMMRKQAIELIFTDAKEEEPKK